MKTVAYIRVSTDTQTEKGYSLDNQLERIKDYCRYNQLPEPEVISDEGISGRSINKRPGMQSILERLPAISHLIVYSMTRLGRNTADVISISNMCHKHSVTLHILDLKIDTSSAAGKMFFQVMASLSEFESNQLSERIRSVQAHNRSVGKRYSRPPLGFNPGPDMEVNPEEMATVLSIFELYDQGRSMKWIADMLNNSGITGKNGGRYRENTISKVLTRRDVYQKHLNKVNIKQSK